MKNFSKTLITVLITAVLTLLISAAVVFFVYSNSDMPFKKLHSVMKIIETSYVGEYDIEQCEENAINTVLETIGDKYAVYYNEKNAEEFLQAIDGYYTGIGIEIFANTEENRIEVISAYEDSPADKAGIESGDLIISIDGTEYTAEKIADAVSYMKGYSVENPLEKEISIVFSRNGEEKTVMLRREVIEMYKVSSVMIDDICYIRYSGFTEKSAEEAEKIVKALDPKKVKGIIFDVRNNGGGEFASAINLCDLFLKDGMIMYTLDKDEKMSVYKADGDATEIPLTIIVNGASASASEIFAGALQARDRATIIGEKTYGKGVSQTVRYLNPYNKSEGAIKLTTCKNYTPDGKWLNEAVTPDIEVSAGKIVGEVKDDEAVKKALEILKQ